jgi:hypothetical protein
MGKLAQFLSFARRTVAGVFLDEAKVDTGGGAIHTVQQFGDPGDDSQPLPGDQALLVESGSAGGFGAVGWHDPTTPRKAGPGGKRIYARNSPGTASAELWIEPSGVVHLEIFTTGQTLFVKNAGGPVVVDSPDVRVGDENASQPIARVGDLVVGAINAISSAPGSPIVPKPPTIATPTGGVPFAGQIVSGAARSKAS